METLENNIFSVFFSWCIRKNMGFKNNQENWTIVKNTSELKNNL